MTHASPSMRDTAVVHRPGRLSRRESRLAFGMTLPSILIVMAIVLFPLLTTFWISAKPIELADLRAPEVRAREQVKGEAVAADDVFLLRYKLRNSSRDKPVLDVRLEDSLPAGLVPLELDPRCELAADRSLRCSLGEFEPGQSETLNIDVRAEQAFIDNPQSAKDSEVVMTGRSLNPLLTLDFTRENFIKAFGVREFGTVLWVTFVYTIGGTAGALVLGLFAALLLNQTFRGRAVFRGFLLFPFVAPVIAAAFTWVVMLDPFSGSLNTLLVQMGAVEAPINFFGVRTVQIQIFGLSIPFPLALSMVIAFEAESGLLGDLVICAPLVQEEATEQHKSEDAHWAHLIIHGVLHLLGHDHQVAAEAEQMEALEIAVLNELGFPDPYNHQAPLEGKQP